MLFAESETQTEQPLVNVTVASGSAIWISYAPHLSREMALARAYVEAVRQNCPIEVQESIHIYNYRNFYKHLGTEATGSITEYVVLSEKIDTTITPPEIILTIEATVTEGERLSSDKAKRIFTRMVLSSPRMKVVIQEECHDESHEWLIEAVTKHFQLAGFRATEDSTLFWNGSRQYVVETCVSYTGIGILEDLIVPRFSQSATLRWSFISQRSGTSIASGVITMSGSAPSIEAAKEEALHRLIDSNFDNVTDQIIDQMVDCPVMVKVTIHDFPDTDTIVSQIQHSPMIRELVAFTNTPADIMTIEVLVDNVAGVEWSLAQYLLQVLGSDFKVESIVSGEVLIEADH